MVADDGVVQRALADGGAEEAAPAVAGGVEAALDLREHLVHPLIVKPGGPFKLRSDFRDHRVGLGARDAAMDRIAQFLRQRRFHRQRQPLSPRSIKVQDRRQRSAQIRLRGLHPDGVNVGTDQVPVPEIDAGRRHRTSDHPGRLAIEVLIVGAAPGAVGEDQGGLPASSRAPAALRVVGRRGRNVAQVDEVELGDVDAELHGRGAEEQRQLAFPKTGLAFLAVLRGHLSGVLACFENALQVHEAAIALDEVAVHLRGKPALVEQGGSAPPDGPRRRRATSAGRRR